MPYKYKNNKTSFHSWCIISEAEFKSSCSSGMLSAVDRYAPGPGKKCAIDTLFDVLKAAGS